jgi:hypothetical protein
MTSYKIQQKNEYLPIIVGINFHKDELVYK